MMIKKLAYAGGALAVLSGLSLTPIFSYGRCGVNWLTATASDSVPMEWELKRARQMIADLRPEIEANAKQIAMEKIQVARIEKQLTESKDRLVKAEADIGRLAADLKADRKEFSYGGKTYTSAQVKTDLANRFKRFKVRQQTAEKFEQMLAARQASLDSAHAKMEAQLNARRQLEVEVENLQARLGALRVAQTSSDLALDNSRLSQTRELLDSIATRIDVEEETINVDVEYFGEIDLDEPTETDLVDEISAYFSSDGDANETAFVSIQLD